MTFWEFVDKQISRFSPSGVAGAGIFALTGVVLAMLFFDRTLARDDLFKTLAQAIVVQGLVGLAMAAWFTKKDESAAVPSQAKEAAQQVADRAEEEADRIASFTERANDDES